MDWTYEIALRGERVEAAALRSWLDGALPALAASPRPAAIDLYEPAAGEASDPYNHDGAGPVMLLMAAFTSREELTAFIGAASGGWAAARALAARPAGISATAAAFERRFYPVGDDSAAAALTAPFSYVVRYHRPAEDEAAFIRNYLDTHPVTQAKLPGIRSIMCYLPLDGVTAAGAADPAYMIGNEVVFDDLAAFNAAMASPVRQDLRAHFHAFPRFSGAVTHHPMTRTRLAL